jgi:ATP-dependent Clp protease ATP-binding subunit ClpB
LNRLDEIITFDILSKEAIREIVGIQVGMITKRLAEKEILELLQQCTICLPKKDNPQYGARPLKRLIQQKILNPVASLMIGKGIVKGGAISVSLKGKEFIFDVKKPRKSAMTESFVVSDSMAV